jgi:hypothetical protein
VRRLLHRSDQAFAVGRAERRQGRGRDHVDVVDPQRGNVGEVAVGRTEQAAVRRRRRAPRTVAADRDLELSAGRGEVTLDQDPIPAGAELADELGVNRVAVIVVACDVAAPAGRALLVQVEHGVDPALAAHRIARGHVDLSVARQLERPGMVALVGGELRVRRDVPRDRPVIGRPLERVELAILRELLFVPLVVEQTARVGNRGDGGEDQAGGAHDHRGCSNPRARRCDAAVTDGPLNPTSWGGRDPEWPRQLPGVSSLATLNRRVELPISMLCDRGT